VGNVTAFSIHIFQMIYLRFRPSLAMRVESYSGNWRSIKFWTWRWVVCMKSGDGEHRLHWKYMISYLLLFIVYSNVQCVVCCSCWVYSGYTDIHFTLRNWWSYFFCLVVECFWKICVLYMCYSNRVNLGRFFNYSSYNTTTQGFKVSDMELIEHVCIWTILNKRAYMGV
jgi:hypothetical protein